MNFRKVSSILLGFQRDIKVGLLFIYLLPPHSKIDFFIFWDLIIVCEINFIIYMCFQGTP